MISNAKCSWGWDKRNWQEGSDTTILEVSDYLIKINIRLPCDPRMQSLKNSDSLYSLKEMSSNVHSSFIHSNKNWKQRWCLSTGRMEKQIKIFEEGILLSNKKEWITNKQNYMNKYQKPHLKWEQPNIKSTCYMMPFK